MLAVSNANQCQVRCLSRKRHGGSVETTVKLVGGNPQMGVTAAVNVWVFGFASYNPYRFLMAQSDSVASNVGSQRLGRGGSTNGTPCPIANTGGWHRFLHAEIYGTRRSRVDVFLPRARDRKTCPFLNISLAFPDSILPPSNQYQGRWLYWKMKKLRVNY